MVLTDALVALVALFLIASTTRSNYLQFSFQFSYLFFLSEQKYSKFLRFNFAILTFILITGSLIYTVYLNGYMRV